MIAPAIHTERAVMFRSLGKSSIGLRSALLKVSSFLSEPDDRGGSELFRQPGEPETDRRLTDPRDDSVFFERHIDADLQFCHQAKRVPVRHAELSPNSVSRFC